MMPVVDASVGLSQNHFSVENYLSVIKQFHVLRMVAMQQQQPNDTAQQELNHFQSQTEIPGLAGFPNAIVASVSLLNPTAITTLVKVDELENLRGVCHCFETHGHFSNRSDWQQSLTILAEKKLCLDLMEVESSDAVVAQMAVFQPELNIIVNIPNTAPAQFQHSIQKLSQLAEYNNVYLKICGADASTIDASGTNTNLYDDAIELFGFDRVMFASGVNRHCSKGMFDRIWSQYVEACSNLSASYRDSLFRTNAVRVYGL